MIEEMHKFSLIFRGLDADHRMLDLYDASQSYYGLARVLSVVGHYYVTGNIIAQAPRSALPLFIVPPEEGSFKQTVAAAALGGIIAAPFTIFLAEMTKRWFPQDDPQIQRLIESQLETNRLLREQLGKPPEKTDEEMEQEENARIHIEKNKAEAQVIRSITSNSFKSVFRPVGRSASTVSIVIGDTQEPLGAVNAGTLGRIEADDVSDKISTIVGVVNSFSRSSKTGIMFSRELERGFRFEYQGAGSLPREDTFSWSQYYGREIVAEGRFVHFFDGSIKKFLVYAVEKYERD
jgi:hypothetical protein